MFKLIEKFEIRRNISKSGYIRYSPSEKSTTNTPSSQTYSNIPTEGSAIILPLSFLKLNFDVLNAATGNRYADDDDIRVINLGPIAVFSTYKLASNPGKHLEKKRSISYCFFDA